MRREDTEAAKKMFNVLANKQLLRAFHSAKYINTLMNTFIELNVSNSNKIRKEGEEK